MGEILGDRGEAVLLEPENLRKQVARRAKGAGPRAAPHPARREDLADLPLTAMSGVRRRPMVRWPCPFSQSRCTARASDLRERTVRR